jgi:hypothetical protein
MNINNIAIKKPSGVFTATLFMVLFLCTGVAKALDISYGCTGNIDSATDRIIPDTSSRISDGRTVNISWDVLMLQSTFNSSSTVTLVTVGAPKARSFQRENELIPQPTTLVFERDINTPSFFRLTKLTKDTRGSSLLPDDDIEYFRLSYFGEAKVNGENKEVWVFNGTLHITKPAESAYFKDLILYCSKNSIGSNTRSQMFTGVQLVQASNIINTRADKYKVRITWIDNGQLYTGADARTGKLDEQETFDSILRGFTYDDQAGYYARLTKGIEAGKLYTLPPRPKEPSNVNNNFCRFTLTYEKERLPRIIEWAFDDKGTLKINPDNQGWASPSIVSGNPSTANYEFQYVDNMPLGQDDKATYNISVKVNNETRIASLGYIKTGRKSGGGTKIDNISCKINSKSTKPEGKNDE